MRLQAPLRTSEPAALALALPALCGGRGAPRLRLTMFLLTSPTVLSL